MNIEDKLNDIVESDFIPITGMICTILWAIFWVVEVISYYNDYTIISDSPIYLIHVYIVSFFILNINIIIMSRFEMVKEHSDELVDFSWIPFVNTGFSFSFIILYVIIIPYYLIMKMVDLNKKTIKNIIEDNN